MVTHQDRNTIFIMALDHFAQARMKFFETSVVVLLFVLYGCAGQRPPEGGPVDTTPPEIISVSPSPNTTGYTSSSISLEFSKYVERRSVEESIFISPYVKNVEFDWSGREVEINFGEKLKKNTTYVVTVGTDVVDINNRNRMAHAFSFAFATGAEIDRGEILGRVFDEKPAGIMIFAYQLDSLKADTLNPMKQKPDYITQTGNVGDYSLTHLAFGSYRVLAVRDEFRNLVYDPETDAMSTAPSDIHLNEHDSVWSDLNFQLSLEDTTPPRLVLATAKDDRHVELKFSENLDVTSLAREDFSIFDTGRTRGLHVVDFFPNLENPSLVVLITESQRQDSLYKVFITGVKDRAGHVINPLASSKQFTIVSTPDTTPPRLIFATALDSTARLPMDGRFQFDFDDALQQQSAEHAVELRDRDSANVPLFFTWNSAASFTAIPRQALQPDYPYTFFILVDSLRDGAGNHTKDSTRKISFRTINPELLGSIEGVIADTDTSHLDRYVVIAENSAEKVKKPVRLTTQRGEKFLFPQINPGEYRLKAFQDEYSSGVYYSGKPFPFIPAERFAVYPDSIKVRARWPVEGVIIKFK
ncbi:MAG: Ig-like domain-containing protein [Bacteroidota bacterium]